MSTKTYQWILMICAGVLAGLVSAAVEKQSWLLPLAAAVFMAVMLVWLRSRVNGVMEDERTQLLQSRAAESALLTFTALATPLSLVLVVMSRPGHFWLAVCGYMLAAVTLVLLLLYQLFAWRQQRTLDTDDA